MIMGGASLGQLTENARNNNYIPLFEAGLEKIQMGTVCLEELLKETSCGEYSIESPTSPPVRALDANPI